MKHLPSLCAVIVLLSHSLSIAAAEQQLNGHGFTLPDGVEIELADVVVNVGPLERVLK